MIQTSQFNFIPGKNFFVIDYEALIPNSYKNDHTNCLIYFKAMTHAKTCLKTIKIQTRSGVDKKLSTQPPKKFPASFISSLLSTNYEELLPLIVP